MKTVVGIDDFENNTGLLKLLTNLNFRANKAHFVHALIRTRRYGWELPQGGMIEKAIKSQEQESMQAFKEQFASHLKNNSKNICKVLKGYSVAEELMSYADKERADLIAVHTTKSGRLNSFTAGRVTKKLLLGAKQSILVSRNENNKTKPLTVVFATDHSDYANKCLRKFIKFAPEGIKRLIVLSVYQPGLLTAMNKNMKSVSVDMKTWVEGNLTKLNDKVVEKLTPLCSKAESKVLCGNVNESIRKVMTKESGDLLVLGAHGHSFIERVSVGSVSFHQVLVEPHSVLVIRA